MSDAGWVDEREFLFNIIKKGCRRMPIGNLILIIIGFIFLVGGIVTPIAIVFSPREPASFGQGPPLAVSLGPSIGAMVCMFGIIMIGLGFGLNTCKILKRILLSALRRDPLIEGASEIKKFMESGNRNHADIKEMLRQINQTSIDAIYQRVNDEIRMRAVSRYNYRRHRQSLHGWSMY